MFCLAASSEENAALLLVNYTDAVQELSLEIVGTQAAHDAFSYTIDQTRTYTEEEILLQPKTTIKLEKDAVVLLKWKHN